MRYPQRRDVMVLMFGTQSVTFWYPTSFPPIPYSSTTSQPLPTPIPNHKREWGEGACAPPQPSRLTRDDLACPSHVLPTNRQTPPAGRVAPIPRWNARPIKSSKTIGDRAAPPRLRGRLVREQQLTPAGRVSRPRHGASHERSAKTS